MGSRADFYVGRGPSAEWLGSIPFDGYPDGNPEPVLDIADEQAFREAVEKILVEEADVATRPSMGWPWPWDDSCTSDFAYCFAEGRVWAHCFGRLIDPKAEVDDRDDEGPKQAFPNMSARRELTLGPRSGLLVVALRK